MKKRIAFYGVFSDTMLCALRQACPENFDTYFVKKGDDLALLADADYMVCRAVPINATVLDYAPKLKAIQKWGVGYEKIDVEEAGKRNIPVMVCVGGNSIPVAELTVALMLDVLRNVTAMNKKLKEGKWAREEFASHTYLLHGKTVGLIGIGNIAKQVASIVRGGFCCRVIYYDLFPLSKEDELRLGVEYVSLEQLMSESDIVSVHVPLLETTAGMINKKHLTQMKPTACLINTSRGGVVNEEDLISALQNRTILGAGLDTFCSEPLSPDSPFLTMENVVATPHCGGNTVDNDRNMANICMDMIQWHSVEDIQYKRAVVNQEYMKHGA